MTLLLGFIQNIGPFQWLILLAFGLLIFGRRLPEVGRSLGKSIVEFKKGLAGIDDEIKNASNPTSEAHPPPPQLPEQPETESRTVSTNAPVVEEPQRTSAESQEPSA